MREIYWDTRTRQLALVREVAARRARHRQVLVAVGDWICAAVVLGSALYMAWGITP